MNHKVHFLHEQWCYDLRGNARTQGDLRRSEGGNIFDSGSRAPVAIILLVKTTKNKKCVIKYGKLLKRLLSHYTIFLYTDGL